MSFSLMVRTSVRNTTSLLPSLHIEGSSPAKKCTSSIAKRLLSTSNNSSKEPNKNNWKFLAATGAITSFTIHNFLKDNSKIKPSNDSNFKNKSPFHVWKTPG